MDHYFCAHMGNRNCIINFRLGWMSQSLIDCTGIQEKILDADIKYSVIVIPWHDVIQLFEGDFGLAGRRDLEEGLGRGSMSITRFSQIKTLRFQKKIKDIHNRNSLFISPKWCLPIYNNNFFK